MRFLLIQLYQTGDVVLTTHIPREIRKIYPDSEIDFLTFEVNRPVIENNPNISDIITITRSGGLIKFINAVKKIRNRRYDGILDFHNNPRSGYITALSGAKIRTTYSTTKRPFLYNKISQRLTGRAGEIKLSLLQPFVKNFHMSDFNYKPEIFPAERSNDKAAEVIKELGIHKDDFIVTISPTHKRDTRRWRIEYFAETAQHLVTEFGAKIILTYGPGEKEYICDSLHLFGEGAHLMPELNLSDFIALIGKAKLHIGNDSAPHHIATAQDVPTFVILGSSNAGWVYGSDQHTYAMLNMECQPCGKAKCRISDDTPCMKGLTFDMIREKLDKFIFNNNIR